MKGKKAHPCGWPLAMKVKAEKEVESTMHHNRKSMPKYLAGNKLNT
jgi:hypothetical protein